MKTEFWNHESCSALSVIGFPQKMVLLPCWIFLVFTVTQVSAKSINAGENHSLQSVSYPFCFIL